MAVKKKVKPLGILIILFLLASVCLIVMGGSVIYLGSPVDKNNKDNIEVEIKSGTSSTAIGKLLKEKDLIKSDFYFKLYLKLNNINDLKATTYQFNKSMSVEEIIDSLQKGNSYNPNAIKITFKEGEWITDYAEVISLNTNNSYDEVINVFKDREYTKTLIDKYWFLTDEIKNEKIYYPLEGYLSPDTYYFDGKDVSVDTIINKMLDETGNKLSSYKDKIKDNVHYYMTMASIVELEGTNTDNRKNITSVFVNRLNNGMNLGSDVTTYYGLQADMSKDLNSQQFASVNAYNTRSTTMIGKMPVGPICNFSKSSIEASVNPTSTDYYFFVADKHGNIFFTRTNKEHVAKVAEIKANGDWIF